MSRELAYVPEATRDFVDAFHYYEGAGTGMGAKFEAAYYRAEREIESGTLAHRTVFEDFRRVNLGRYPYALYYQIRGDTAVIVGLFYTRRNPSAIRQTLKFRSR